MLVYSYKGQEPQPLPERIRLSNGLTRTDSLTFTEEEIADAGYTLSDPKPVVDPNQQKVSWTTSGWVVENLSDQEIQSLIDQEWSSVRNKRNELLKNTDWLVIKATELGKAVNEEIVNYRQALRDITTQEDPFNIIWPMLTSGTQNNSSVGSGTQ